MRSVHGLAALVLLALPVPALADEAAADDCLRAKIWSGYAEGWRVRTATRTTLGEGEHRVYLVTLYQGNEYKFMGCGDSNVANIDLVIYDAKGNKLAGDVSSDREPVMTYTPTVTNSYYLVVHASKLNVPEQKGGVATAVTHK